MTTGRIIGIVGPSGVGKDSVMAAIAAADPRWSILRRVITRRPHAGGEDFDPVSPAAFAQRLTAGEFALHWTAHGLSYGIARAALGADQWMLVNLSRSVLTDAQALFPDFIALNLTAEAETLAARLKRRDRESVEGIRARLAHNGACIPPHVNAVTISNDGAIDDTVAAALRALQPAIVP